MKKKIVSLTGGTTATITVTDPSSSLGWSAEIQGVSFNRTVFLKLSGEEIWRSLWHLIEEAEYYKTQYPDSKEKELVETYIPKEYIELAKRLKKKRWETYEGRYGEYPIRPGITVSLNPRYSPPVMEFRGAFPGQFFEMRLTDLVDIIRVALGLIESSKKEA